ncbi:MAG: hypothetical protein Q9191_000826 [Dirinaria sp. TL-2023a]
MPNNTLANSPESSPPVTSEKDAQQIWDQHSANPFNWPESKKWKIVLVAASVTLLTGINTTSIATPSHEITHKFHVSDAVFPNSVWLVTVWNIGSAFGPMVGLPLLENFGIRHGYLVNELSHPETRVTRTIAGVSGGTLQNAMVTFVADMWLTDKQRNLPITLYILVLTAGVSLGPAFGAISGSLYWRCNDHRLAKLNSAATQISISSLAYEAIMRPAYLLCSEPVVFFLMLWSAFSFGLVLMMTQSVAQVYSTNHGFSDPATGLVQIALFVGEAVGFLACLPQNAYYQRSATRNTVNVGVPIPEARLPLSILASLVGLAGGLFWYAWTSFAYIHWILPTIGLAFVGFGIMIIISTVGLYITDAYTKYAGSAIAAVVFGENMFAAWLPLATKAMYTNLGFRWASSLLGFVALVLTLAPILLLVKGETIRRRSKFISEASYT